MAALRISFLGKPVIQLNGQAIPGLVSRKSEALLCYLAFTGQPHSRQALSGLLWSDMPEERARRNLRVALTRLRAELSDYLVIQRRTLAFNRERPYQLDVTRFETLLRQKSPTIETLQQATALYRGPFLDDFVLRDALLFEEWVRQQQEHYRQMAIDGLHRLAALQTEAGQISAGIKTVGRLLQLEPWLEEAHRQMMLLLALNGQRSAALAQFDLCAALLDEELGVTPTAETAELYQKIRDEQMTELVPPRLVPLASPVRSLPPPFQVPALVPHFVGREELKNEIAVALKTEGETAVQAIVGMGGVGKSSLAAQIAAQLQPHFPDGILWAHASVSEPMSVLESWAQLFGYDFSRVSDVESMAAAFRSALAEKKLLMVLDDVTSAARIRPLLPAGPHCRVLITLRDLELAHALAAQVWPLQELSAENGRLLFTKILGAPRVQEEPEAADKICEELAHLPLAVEITAQRLKSRPRRKLADMAQRLRDEKLRLSLLTLSDREVRASFAISWETLGSELKNVFALLGLFGGGSFSAEAVAYVADLDPYLLEDRLYALVTLSLLREESATRYRQHPLLADFAREQLGEGVAEEYGRFATYFLHFAQKHQHNYDTLRPEWDNLMHAMSVAHQHQYWPIVLQFASALQDAWFTRGRFTQARQGLAWALAAARASQDTAAEATILRHWGLAALEQRDFEPAAQHLTQSTRLFTPLKDQTGIAQNQCDLARIAVEQSNFSLAEQYLETSRTIREKQNDWIGLAESLHVEARMHYFQGDHAETIRLGQKAVTLLTDNQMEEKAVRTLSLLASAYIMQRQFEVANRYAQQALHLSEQRQDKGDTGVILSVLSYIAHMQDDLETAQTYAEQSLSLLQTIGDLGSQAMTFYKLGGIYLAKNQPALALEASEKSLALCQQSQFYLQQGWTLIQLAKCCQAMEKQNAAQQYWRDAWKMAQSLQNKALLDAVREQSPISHQPDSVQDPA